MMKITTLFIFVTLCNAKGFGGGGNSRGYGSGGSSRARAVRGSYQESTTGFRNNHILTYWLIAGSVNRRQRSYLYEETKPPDDQLFDCGNGVKIPEDKLCNWIDDCGNGIDEQVPLPCEGEPSSLELELYVILTMIFGIWIIIISILLKTTYQSQEKYAEQDKTMRDKLVFMMISPGLLLFINICFLCAANVEEKSIIIEYYITNCVFVTFCFVISLCIQDKCNIGLWFGLLLLTIITMYHGSIVFSYIPKNLFKEVDYDNITTTAFNSSVDHLFHDDLFWLTQQNQSESFIINFDEIIYLTTIVLYPTYPYKTTDQFSISIGINQSSWTNVLRGPMPFIHNKSSLETTISDDGIPVKYLKFTGTPHSDCNNTLNKKKCYVGLDTLELYELDQE